MLNLRNHLRAGFTLAEVLVSVAIVAALSAVVVPAVRGRLQDGYENALIEEYTNLASGINAYRQDVGKYPPRLDYLTAIPALNTATDFCGNFLTAADIARWRGPYVSRNILPSNYVVAQADTVQDGLIRLGGFLNTIQIRIIGPDATTASNIDVKIDGLGGIPGRTIGTILWSVNGQVTEVRYVIPTRTNAC